MTKTDKPNEQAKAPVDYRRGQQHLRVGIELSDAGATIASIWLVDQPAMQPVDLPRELVARIDLAGKPVLFQSFDDPRISRSTYRRGVGHHFGRYPTGMVHVSVPFTQALDLDAIGIQLVDRTQLATAAIDIESVAKALDSLAHKPMATLASSDLRAHRDWEDIASKLGLPKAKGRFEIYVDKAGEYRWRLRGPDGQVYADCGEGFASRAQCERELQWVRANAQTTPITSLDVKSV